MPWDDGRVKATHEDILNGPDLQEMMAQRYPLHRFNEPPPVNFEPGRVRYEPFFFKMYGATAKEVWARSTYIRWTPSQKKRRLRVSTVHDIHLKLKRIADALNRLPKRFHRYFETSAGTFNWRHVKRTQRQSMHSFAIAIDLGVKHAHYWDWTKPDKKTGRYVYRNRFPKEVVDIFEAEGFIWGGKWYHFDTMHFEYRPELLQPDCVDAPDAP